MPQTPSTLLSTTSMTTSKLYWIASKPQLERSSRELMNSTKMEISFHMWAKLAERGFAPRKLDRSSYNIMETMKTEISFHVYKLLQSNRYWKCYNIFREYLLSNDWISFFYFLFWHKYLKIRFLKYLTVALW